MGITNELDRHRFEMDPHTINVMPTKCIVRRKTADTKKGSLYLPQAKDNKEALFEGWIAKIGDQAPEDYEDLQVGNHVFFSYQVGADDSAFFTWQDSHYAIIPIEAIQLVVA